MQPPPAAAAPMVVSTIQTPQRKEHYMSKCVLGLSVTHIIIGALCILLQVVLIGIHSPIHFVGQGIWTGVFIVTFLVLAIISLVITIGILMASYIEIVMSQFRYYYRDSSVSSYAVIGVNAVLIIMAVLQAVLACISSGFSCHGLCGGNKNQSMVIAGQVQYTQGPDGQQQMVIVPFNQQGAALPALASFNPAQAELPAYSQTPPPLYEIETKLPIPE